MPKMFPVTDIRIPDGSVTSMESQVTKPNLGIQKLTILLQFVEVRNDLVGACLEVLDKLRDEFCLG